MSEGPARMDPWARLRRLTPARIALGHAGTSLPTRAHLEFQLAHAQARDAVHLAFDPQPLCEALHARDRTCLRLHSAAADRHAYLQRPDLGRRLDPASAEALAAYVARHGGGADLAVVVADGLSALAVHRHAPAMLERIEALCGRRGCSLAPVALVAQGRVAVGDEIGERLGAQAALVLIGERPGLSSPDSLGLYLTWAPRVGCNDAQRNCISNIRTAGLGYAEAAHTLDFLLGEAFRRRLSGVQLKDEASAAVAALESDGTRPGNFLLPDSADP